MSKANQKTTFSLLTRILAAVERVGNKLPDPTVLFIVLLFMVWVLSWLLSYITFSVVDPRTSEPLVINNLLSGSALTEFMSVMVINFAHFHPVGVVLVAMGGSSGAVMSATGLALTMAAMTCYAITLLVTKHLAKSPTGVLSIRMVFPPCCVLAKSTPHKTQRQIQRSR